jgi:hypothetical protein
MMAVTFPNVSRSYDSSGNRVRFWGYDSAMEITFYVEEAALFRLSPKTSRVEAGILAAFDAARDRIMEVAAKIYSFEKRGFYILVASDFR